MSGIPVSHSDQLAPSSVVLKTRHLRGARGAFDSPAAYRMLPFVANPYVPLSSESSKTLSHVCPSSVVLKTPLVAAKICPPLFNISRIIPVPPASLRVLLIDDQRAPPSEVESTPREPPAKSRSPSTAKLSMFAPNGPLVRCHCASTFVGTSHSDKNDMVMSTPNLEKWAARMM